MVKCEDCKKKIIESEKGKSEEEIFFENYSDEKYCMAAVKENGCALQYVKDQSEAVCMEAVKRNGCALQYVKDQSEAVCMEAVKGNGCALRYVKDIKVFRKIFEKKNEKEKV